MSKHDLVIGGWNGDELDVAVIIPDRVSGGIIILPELTIEQIREIVDRLMARKQRMPEDANG